LPPIPPIHADFSPSAKLEVGATGPTSGSGLSPDGGFGVSPDGGFGVSPDGGFGVSPDGGFGVSPDGGFGVSPEGELFKFEPHHLPPPPATHHTPHTIAKIPNIAHDTGKNIMYVFSL
jgi:hypothetical protein